VVVRAILAAGLLALAGCSGLRQESRALPADPRAPILYVALGDSTVEGIGATSAERNYVSRLHQRLRAIYPAARVANLGVAGATSIDVLDGQVPRAVALAPDLVTLSVGPNDITGRVAVREFESNVDRILRALTARPDAVVVVNLLPDLAVTPRFRSSPERQAVGRQSEAFNEALRRVAGRHGAALVDLHEASRQEVPRQPELVARDGYHPSDLGYARWAELMWHGLQGRIAACQEESEAWTRC
jgi:lysophospholipase L1-like esterase